MQRLLSPLDLKTNPHFTVDTERSLRNEGGGSLVWDPADGFLNGEKHSLASAGRCHYRHTSEILRFGGREAPDHRNTASHTIFLVSRCISKLGSPYTVVC